MDFDLGVGHVRAPFAVAQIESWLVSAGDGRPGSLEGGPLVAEHGFDSLSLQSSTQGDETISDEERRI